MGKCKKRRVMTLSEEAFLTAVEGLQRCVAASGFEPEAILSIRHGGEFVGKPMFAGLPHYAVTLQRSSTKRKNRLFAAVVKRMPLFLLDRMRILEAWMLSKKKPAPIDSPRIVLPDLTTFRRILIVDDAVDSGATLAAIRRSVSTLCPRAVIKTAVITVTTQSPLIVPDFYLYHNFTLIRFPWSLDSKAH